MLSALLAVLAAAPIGDSVVAERLADVELRLRAARTTHLSPEARTRRSTLLDALALYRKRGVFPHNHHVAGGRHPVFIDEHGAACAVAFLMIASGNAGLAHDIAAAENFARVPEIRHPAVGVWAANHGFTVDELTAIQPAYKYSPERCDVARTWVGSPTVSYLLTYSHHLWRLEASGARSVTQLPGWFTTLEPGKSFLVHGCSTAEETIWLTAQPGWGQPIRGLLRGRWDVGARVFALESVELPDEPMTTLNCRPGEVTLYTTVVLPAQEAQNQWWQAWGDAKKQEWKTGKWSNPPDVEFPIDATFATLDETGAWRSPPPLHTTGLYKGSFGFRLLDTPRLTVRVDSGENKCLAVQDGSWLEAPCPAEAAYQGLVSRHDEEERAEASKRPRAEVWGKAVRPTYLLEVGSHQFSVGRTSTPDCEPVLRDDLEPFVPRPPPADSKQLGRGPVTWLLVVVALIVAGGGPWLILRRRRRKG